jgi:hypothetical protein
MVPQVQVVSILMIVNGSLVSLMGLLLAAVGPTMFVVVGMDQHKAPMRPDDRTALTIITVAYTVGGVLVLTAGVLNVIAGIRSLKFRGRALALTALFFNIIPLFTCYCLPTSLGLMIYGLIVFFNADVARAFRLAAEGVLPEEIRNPAAFERYQRYDDDEDDYQR